jgi:spermidine synthase
LPRWSLPLLAILFFCSGVCALIYQVMWLRMLALVFGVTVYAASTVLASFMGGLALGSFVAGRLAGRVTSPLRVFGLIEIGVGLSALATPLVMDVIRSAWIALSPSLPSSLLFLTGSRFVAAFAVLIVPTTLMGATLPVVMRSALVSDRSVGARIGLLYAINTAGAIFGALVAGFYLVAEVGLTRSFQFAALLNVSIGVVAILAAKRLPSDQRDAPKVLPTPVAMIGDRSTATQDTTLTTAQRYAVLWTFLLSGVMSLALEIVWFRMLVTMLRPTAYAFTIMLAAVLAGIALGSAIAAPLLRRRREWLAILTGVQLMIGLTAVLSLNTLRYTQAASEFAVPVLTRIGLDPYLGPIIVASLLAMLPTTLLLGFAFPVGLSLWVGAAEGSSRRVGSFYSLNVCGAIFGSVLGGFVLLPLLGSRGSLIATAGLAAFSSVLLAIPQWRGRPNFAGFMTIVGPVAFAMAALNAADPYAITTDSAHRNERVLWRQEGVQTTVAIHETRQRRRTRIMYLDGMHQASDLPSMTFVHHRIGAFPMLLHPNPTAALVVGLGGGATAGAVAQYPGVSVDVVELSSAVVGGASFFGHINFGVLQRPNVQLRVDDGRNYLLTTTRKYDIITADIILPRHAGAGALYSREYFQLVRRALKDDGLALQWNGAEGAAYGLIVRTFLSVFPHATLWADGTLMVGSKKPLEFSRAAYEQRRANPEFRRLFDWSFDEIVATYAGGPPDLAQWAGDGDILTDDRPIIEYFLSLPDDQPPDLRRLVARPSDIVRP